MQIQDKQTLKKLSFMHTFAVHGMHTWNLLNIDYTGGFQCSKCGPSPSLVIMDGTALSFRRQLDYWSDILPPSQPTTKETIIPKGRYACNNKIFYNVFIMCSFPARIMIADPTLRQLIAQYIKVGLTEDEMVDLIRLSQEKCAFLVGLFTHLTKKVKSAHGLHQCPEPWKDFVHSIGSSSPVCSLIPPNKHTIASIIKCNDSIEDIVTDPGV